MARPALPFGACVSYITEVSGSRVLKDGLALIDDGTKITVCRPAGGAGASIAVAAAGGSEAVEIMFEFVLGEHVVPTSDAQSIEGLERLSFTTMQNLQAAMAALYGEGAEVSSDAKHTRPPSAKRAVAKEKKVNVGGLDFSALAFLEP